MTKRLYIPAAALLILSASAFSSASQPLGAEPGRRATPQKGAASEAAALEIRKQQLAAKEAALAIKEQELKSLAATLDARVKELEAAKAGLDRTLDARKKVQRANYQKLLKVYKGLKPDEAAKFLDKLDEDQALELLDEMDQKRAAKLLPLIKQDRALKWTKQNLAAK